MHDQKLKMLGTAGIVLTRGLTRLFYIYIMRKEVLDNLTLSGQIEGRRIKIKYRQIGTILKSFYPQEPGRHKRRELRKCY